LQRFTLRVAGALVHDNANQDRVLLRPGIAFKSYHHDHVELIEPDVAVSTLANMISITPSQRLFVGLGRTRKDKGILQLQTSNQSHFIHQFGISAISVTLLEVVDVPVA
jgi:hypothetical protein